MLHVPVDKNWMIDNAHKIVIKYNYVKESELDILSCMEAVSQQIKYQSMG